MIAWGCARPLEAHQSDPLATQICGLKMISCVNQIAATAFYLLQKTIHRPELEHFAPV